MVFLPAVWHMKKRTKIAPRRLFLSHSARIAAISSAPKKPTYQLGMKDNGKGSVEIFLLDKNGCVETRGKLLRMGKRTGKVTFIEGIDSKYGFDLTSAGKLKVR